MKVLVIGATGFIGRAVVDAIQDGHEVHQASRSIGTGKNKHTMDLRKPDTIRKVFQTVEPEVIVINSGIVPRTGDVQDNVLFTQNILDQVSVLTQLPKRIIVSGSAGEYGEVKPDELPVKENNPLRASSEYGISKKRETTIALEFGKRHGIQVIVGRIFNAVGSNMILVQSLLGQLDEIYAGTRLALEVSRLDSKRDYINVKDIGSAFRCFIERNPMQSIYNIGSGRITSNQDLIDMLLKDLQISPIPKIIETEPNPELLLAIQADNSLLVKEFNWSPQYTIEETVKEIAEGSNGKR